ncbi:MAG: hypothetical protein GX557_08775, partial [Chloroflexi bacterium]|nr:hypothetical protein [Chloroflexota bacterium]
MIRIEASIPCSQPPAWALWERQLFAALDEAVYPYLARYTEADGTLIYRDDFRSRDGADDFYVSFVNWPRYYLLGGGDHILELAHRQWEATTRRLTRYGNVYREYERGYDQFHQGESYPYFYELCLADPGNPLLLERARRFAGLYLGEDPEAPNYDATLRMIRSPHNGSGGPIEAWDAAGSYGYSEGMAVYGLPYADVPGVRSYEDLRDPAKARRMGQAMHARMSWGDVPSNLCVTSLVANAFLATGDAKYRRWVEEYVGVWAERARANGGLLPDNVGASGQVGETLGGRWYGGLYGWTWPHGFYNVGMAACVAASNAHLLTGREECWELARAQIDAVMARGEERNAATEPMSLRHHWVGVWRAAEQIERMWLVPYRYGDAGWFDYQPLPPMFAAAIWNATMAESDWQRVLALRARGGYDWRKVCAFHTKEDSGHEAPWLAYLMGDNPDYPEHILAASYEAAARRLAVIREDESDPRTGNIHQWQQVNPVSTEALVQLTMGAPQTLYNGGLLITRLRYWDAVRRRPGLPPDVAALVEELQPERTVVR